MRPTWKSRLRSGSSRSIANLHMKVPRHSIPGCLPIRVSVRRFSGFPLPGVAWIGCGTSISSGTAEALAVDYIQQAHRALISSRTCRRDAVQPVPSKSSGRRSPNPQRMRSITSAHSCGSRFLTSCRLFGSLPDSRRYNWQSSPPRRRAKSAGSSARPDHARRSSPRSSASHGPADMTSRFSRRRALRANGALARLPA
jgi:hypothetical protein